MPRSEKVEQRVYCPQCDLELPVPTIRPSIVRCAGCNTPTLMMAKSLGLKQAAMIIQLWQTSRPENQDEWILWLAAILAEELNVMRRRVLANNPN